MIFKISKKNKDDIQKKISKDKKSVRITMAIGKWILIIGVSSSLIYLALNILIPSWSMATVGGIYRKDYEWPFLATVIVIGCSTLINVFLRTLAMNLASSNNTERIDEALILDNDILKYTFRIIYQSNPKDRNVITIPLNKIQEVIYNDDKKSLLFKGTFISDYVENYGPNNSSSKTAEEIDEMLIYDYFKPSLLDTLKEKGIRIEEQGQNQWR